MHKSVGLSPEREQQAVDALTSADWSTDPDVGTVRVADALSVDHDLAGTIVRNLRERRIVRHRTIAQDAVLGELVRLSPIRWVRDEMPTTLEILDFLTGFDEVASLDETRRLLCQKYRHVFSQPDANTLLHDLRDRNILQLETISFMREKWVRVPLATRS